jgi:Type II restriction endonuclease EcoO109I
MENKMNSSEIEPLIRQSLDNFYQRRINKLSGLKLKDTLKKKNPYLFRAVGIQKASEIVERLLRDYMSSSDEGIFGDAFFEPIVKICSGGVAASGEGIDVVVETEAVYKPVAVKSGPNIFNASQAKRMNQEFMSLRSRMHKLHKKFDPLLGHGYGCKNSDPTANRI